MQATLTAQESGGGGALALARLAGIVVSRSDAEAALAFPVRSTSGMVSLDPRAFVPQLPDSHIAIQAARLKLAAEAALAAVDAEAAEQAQLAEGYIARMKEAAEAINGPRYEKAEQAYQKLVKDTNRRGIAPPPFIQPERVEAGQRLERALVVTVRQIQRGPGDPREYLEPHEHGLLAVRERRATLQAERRDLQRLIAAADARMGATWQEAADLLEQVFTLGPAYVGMGTHGDLNIGPPLSAFCKLRALTTEAFALAIWERALAHWRRQLED